MGGQNRVKQNCNSAPQPDGTMNPDAWADLVEQAHARLQGKVVWTPVAPLKWLDRKGPNGSSLEVRAKLDCHQHSGSFKYRGALNALLNTTGPKVITASAGNHALALCAAAKATGKKAHVALPIGVSEIKAKRIIAEADEVSFSGKDLFEATLAAKKLAKEGGGEYVSPYADVHVAAGAGTMIVEATEDAGHFDAIIVPLRGGGLAAGVASWCAIHSPETKVIVAHPAIFGRIEEGEPVSAALTKPINPTVCDGLAVQWVEKSRLADILDALITDTVAVTEDEATASVAESLRFQSLLLEGSAATAIAALHQASDSLSGRVLLLLTGQNIASTNVARALVQTVEDDDMRRRAGLSNIFNPANRHNSNAQGGLQDGPKGVFQDAVVPLEKDPALQTVHILVERLLKDFDRHAEVMEQHRALAEQLSLRRDPWCEGIGDDGQSRARALAVSLKNDLVEGTLSVWLADERYRVLLQLYSSTYSMFERASPSYDQAITDWFGDSAAQNSAMVNYDRCGAIQLRDDERMLLSKLRPSEREEVNLSLMLTSSGMAAYQCIQHCTLQRLRPSDTILLPPYIYFEAMEQLQSFAKAGHLQLQ
jgi:threonine dehydratase